MELAYLFTAVLLFGSHFADAVRPAATDLNAEKASPWPESFLATTFVNFSMTLTLASYTYDWHRQATAQVFWSQSGSGYQGQPDFQIIAWGNGTMFVIDLTGSGCQVLQLPPPGGVLPPRWPENLQFVGEKKVNNISCKEFEATGEFFSVKYDTSLNGSPIRMVTSASGPEDVMASEVQYMTFLPGYRASAKEFQAPMACFAIDIREKKAFNYLATEVVGLMKDVSPRLYAGSFKGPYGIKESVCIIGGTEETHKVGACVWHT